MPNPDSELLEILKEKRDNNTYSFDVSNHLNQLIKFLEEDLQ